MRAFVKALQGQEERKKKRKQMKPKKERKNKEQKTAKGSDKDMASKRQKNTTKKDGSR